jgi:hypothetical protein
VYINVCGNYLADGFKGSGTTYRRTPADRIDVFNVQGSRFGGQSCVNVAVHFSFLPSAGGGHVADREKLKEYECAFRGRLHEAGETDHWWTYGASDRETKASIASRLTGVSAALTMARIMNHLGRREKCREFAEVGLRRPGSAVGLRAELERLRDTI